MYQTLTALACSLGSMCLGSLMVWPSYTLPMLAASNNTILSAPLTGAEEAMLGSLPAAGAAVGAAIMGCYDTFGRKRASLVMTLLFAISWCTIGMTSSIMVVLMARFLGGFAGGATMVVNPVYIAEVVEDGSRGILASGLVILYGFGSLVSYVIGWICDYTTIAWINLGLAIFRGAILVCVPESPLFLVKKKKIEEARVSLSVYRRVPKNSTIVQEELAKIRQQLSSPLDSVPLNENGEVAEMAKLTSDIKERPQPRFHALKTLCLSPASRRGFIILLMAFTMEVLMGLAPVQVYAKQVFVEADPYHGDLYSVILAVCWCLGSVLCSALTDRFGRRVLLITSASSSGVCLVILGALLQTQLAPPWVTVLFIMVFCFCFLCGSGTVPYVLMCELFSPEVQTLASMLIVQWLFISAFIILALFNWLSRLVGIHYIFYGFAVNSCIYVLFSYFVIPETKGLSNKQIQQALLEGR